MLLKQGQIIVLKMRVNNSSTVLPPHPYIIINTDVLNNKVEITQMKQLSTKTVMCN